MNKPKNNCVSKSEQPKIIKNMSDKHIVKTNWKGNLTFQSEINGHKLIMDAPEAGGGNDLGPSPKRLLLAAIAGCSGMDVVSILKKMRVEIENVEIEVSGDVADENPKYYERMHVIYTVTGKDIPLDKVEKAVKMSEETYCGVGALYRKAIEITSEIKIIES
jgi:putative redox protein